MKIALVHDDLVQYGGAERVLAGLSEIFPDAPIYTSLFDKNNPDLVRQFKGKKVSTSFLQKIPGWKVLYKILLPLYPLAFEQFDFSGFDLVISQSTRFAKGIITKPGTIHVNYCHTPPRFLWDDDLQIKLPEPLLSYFRRYDKIAAFRVDYFIAGSGNARERIREVYGVDCPVVYPFVDIDRFANLESFNGGYFVVIARLNQYKRVDLAIEACAKLKLPLKIIGAGPKLGALKHLADSLGGKIEFLGRLPDELTGEVLAGAKALIICAKEDFGITSLEAQALGKPVIAFARGGALETVIPQRTGFLFKQQSAESLVDVLQEAPLSQIDPKVCISNARKFSKKHFTQNFRKQVDFLLK